MDRLPIIFAVSLIFNILAIILFAPPVLVFDEGSYALMLSELSQDASMVIPTVTGEAAEYKPPLFTWALLPFYYLLKLLPIPIEIVLRLPSALFGALSVVLLYLISKKLYGEKTALFAAALFLTCPAIIFNSSLLLMESFSILLILSSLYFFLEENVKLGALFLGLLVLTKWLYVVSPIAFLLLYFLKKPQFKNVLMSLITIPLFIAVYLGLAFLFGNIDNALHTFLFDVFRSQPEANPLFFFGNLLFMLWYTFPVSSFFIFFLVSNRSEIVREKHLIAMALIILLGMFSEKFLPWYSSISIPAMIIFLALSISKFGKMIPFALATLLFLNLISLTAFPLTKQNPETKGIAEFSEGKSVTFYETKRLFLSWERINERYAKTENSRLLLEQNNPGLLFYRFSESKDYHNLNAVFSDFNETPPCDDYLVVNSNASVPSCYGLLWNTSKYWVYSTKE